MENYILSLILDASGSTDYFHYILLGVFIAAIYLFRRRDNKRMESEYRELLSQMAQDVRRYGGVPAENLVSGDSPKEAGAGGTYSTDALDIIVDVLCGQGCEMEELEDDDGDDDADDGKALSDDHKAIRFMYQGESILLIASNKSSWVKLYDRFWYSVPLDDIDKVAFLRKAINQVNSDYSGVKLVYSFYENKEMYVHTELSFTLLREMPHYKDYIIGMLRLLLASHSMLNETMEELKKEENK